MSPSEFSRPLALGRVGPEGRTEVLEATESERVALARRFRHPRSEASARHTAAGTGRGWGHHGARPDRGGGGAGLRGDAGAGAAAGRRGYRLPPVADGREPSEGPDEPDEIESEHGSSNSARRWRNNSRWRSTPIRGPRGRSCRPRRRTRPPGLSPRSRRCVARDRRGGADPPCGRDACVWGGLVLQPPAPAEPCCL